MVRNLFRDHYEGASLRSDGMRRLKRKPDVGTGDIHPQTKRNSDNGKQYPPQGDLVRSLLKTLRGFWEESSGVAPKLLRSALNVDISRQNACWGNFLEACSRAPGTSQKLLQNSTL